MLLHVEIILRRHIVGSRGLLAAGHRAVVNGPVVSGQSVSGPVVSPLVSPGTTAVVIFQISLNRTQAATAILLLLSLVLFARATVVKYM